MLSPLVGEKACFRLWPGHPAGCTYFTQIVLSGPSVLLATECDSWGSMA